MYGLIIVSSLSSFVLIYGVYFTFMFLKYVIYKRIILHFLKTSINLKDTGQWAVITGCTDGIGRAFTYKLAEIGMDVVLISRSKGKLDSLAADLNTKHGTKTKVIVADFKNTDKVIPEIKKELGDMDIGVLINNVGIQSGIGEFLDNDRNEVIDMIEVNVKGTMRMCSTVLPGMVKKKKGVIINMSSLSASLPTPYISSYSASKAFIMKFSSDLNKEYKQSGITIHCLLAGFVATKINNLPELPIIIPSPESYVKRALKTIGLSDITTGYIIHDLHEICLKSLEEISGSVVTLINYFMFMVLGKTLEVKSTASKEKGSNPTPSVKIKSNCL